MKRYRVDPMTVRDLIGHNPGWKNPSVKQDLKALRRSVADLEQAPSWIEEAFPLSRMEAEKSGAVKFNKPQKIQ